MKELHLLELQPRPRH